MSANLQRTAHDRPDAVQVDAAHLAELAVGRGIGGEYGRARVDHSREHRSTHGPVVSVPKFNTVLSARYELAIGKSCDECALDAEHFDNGIQNCAKHAVWSRLGVDRAPKAVQQLQAMVRGLQIC